MPHLRRRRSLRQVDVKETRKAIVDILFTLTTKMSDHRSADGSEKRDIAKRKYEGGKSFLMVAYVQALNSPPAENGVITRPDVSTVRRVCMVKAEVYIAKVVLGTDQGRDRFRGVRTGRMEFKQRIDSEARKIASNGDAEVDRFTQIIQGMNIGWRRWAKATRPQDILPAKR